MKILLAVIAGILIYFLASALAEKVEKKARRRLLFVGVSLISFWAAYELGILWPFGLAYMGSAIFEKIQGSKRLKKVSCWGCLITLIIAVIGGWFLGVKMPSGQEKAMNLADLAVKTEIKATQQKAKAGNKEGTFCLVKTAGETQLKDKPDKSGRTVLVIDEGERVTLFGRSPDLYWYWAGYQQRTGWIPSKSINEKGCECEGIPEDALAPVSWLPVKIPE
jgi:hypothetical protein